MPDACGGVRPWRFASRRAASTSCRVSSPSRTVTMSANSGAIVAAAGGFLHDAEQAHVGEPADGTREPHGGLERERRDEDDVAHRGRCNTPARARLQVRERRLSGAAAIRRRCSSTPAASPRSGRRVYGVGDAPRERLPPSLKQHLDGLPPGAPPPRRGRRGRARARRGCAAARSIASLANWEVMVHDRGAAARARSASPACPSTRSAVSATSS